MYHRAQNFIAELFRKRERIRKIIVNEYLSQNYSTDVDELCLSEEERSQCTIKEQKDAGNDVTYDVTYDVPNFNVSNVFEYERT